MKSKITFTAIVLIGTVFLQACKDSEVDDIPPYAYYECALNTYRNGLYPENECLEEGQKPTKAILELFEEAEQDHNIEQIAMFEQALREQQAREERQHQEATRRSNPDHTLEWFEDDSMGTLVEGWRVVSLENEITVTGIVVNRGNCKVTLGADVPLWFLTDAPFPVKLVYGKPARFLVSRGCDVREVAVTTSNGSWTWRPSR